MTVDLHLSDEAHEIVYAVASSAKTHEHREGLSHEGKVGAQDVNRPAEDYLRDGVAAAERCECADAADLSVH